MEVYCVMESDWEGNFLCSIWSTEELAQSQVDLLHDKYLGRDFFVEPHTLDKEGGE